MIDRSQILSRIEVQTVLDDLKRRARWAPTTKQNMVFRLAVFCGLRACEIMQLRMSDIIVDAVKPRIRVRKDRTKTNRYRSERTRYVPLWWDEQNWWHIKKWAEWRRSQGAENNDLFLPTKSGRAMTRCGVWQIFKSATKALGRPTTVKDGRHTFISHALYVGHSIVEVQQAAGHANLSSTNCYAHLVIEDDGFGQLFGRNGPRPEIVWKKKRKAKEIALKRRRARQRRERKERELQMEELRRQWWAENKPPDIVPWTIPTDRELSRWWSNRKKAQ